MIRYVGGKTRLAKDIAAVIKQHIQPQHLYYYEPFFGGGSMAQYTKAFGLWRIANDIHPGLINMYRMLQMGWEPPKYVNEAQYKELQNTTDESLSASALRAYVGFGCSFGGKWFGGYARDKTGKRKLDHESYNRIIEHVDDIDDITFLCMDYRLLFPVTNECVIYCDPPYAGTLGYNTGNFDHISFWNTMRNWSNNGAAVFISEYEAPDDFKIVWEKPRKTYMHHKATNNEHIERLFIRR